MHNKGFTAVCRPRQVHVLVCFGGQKENSCRMGSSAWNDFKLDIHTHIMFFERTVALYLPKQAIKTLDFWL
jgi:hypothetical protein